MLQRMRDKMQGLIAGAIAAVIALTFALWGIQNYLHTNPGAQTVAKVNGNKITQQELHVVYERSKRQEMLKLGADFNLDQKVQAQLKQQVLDQLVKKQVMQQALNKMGLGVGNGQMNAIIAGLPLFQSNGHFSLERFQQVLQNLFYSEQEFISEMEGSVTQMQLMRGIADSQFVLPNETVQAKNLSLQQRDFGYLLVPTAHFASTATVTEKAINDYYQSKQKEFMLPEQVSVQYLELDADKLQQNINPTPAQLQQFYQDHLGSFSTPARWQVAHVSMPATPVSLQKLQTVSEQAKKVGGLAKISEAHAQTTWVTKKELPAEIALQLDKLTVGQISAPIRSKDGYHLLQVISTTPAVMQKYESIADKVKTAYLHRELQQAFAAQNDKLTDLVYTNSDSLEPAAQALGLKIQTSDLVTAAGTKNGILANPKLLKAAFSEAVLKQSYNSTPIEISSGKVVVLRIKEHIPEKLQPLAQVRAQIEQKLRREAMHQQAEALSKTLLDQLQHGSTSSQLASKNNLTWKPIIAATREQKDIGSKLLDAAFNLAKPAQNTVSATTVDLGEDYAVVQLTKVYDAPATTTSTTVETFVGGLANELGQFDYSLFVDKLMRAANIKIESAVASIDDKASE